MSTIKDVFPAKLGDKWVYIYSTMEQDSVFKFHKGTIIRQVVYLENIKGRRIIGIEQTGDMSDLKVLTDCACDRFHRSNIWLADTGHLLFERCNYGDAYYICDGLNKAETNLSKFYTYNHDDPELKVPLAIGKSWAYMPELSDYKRTDGRYMWIVLGRSDVNVSAGLFKNCYKIAFRAGGDTVIRYVYPGVGIVLEEYRHNGTVLASRAELAKFPNQSN